jgi:uncharacterized protein (TIGR01777 family)
MQVVLAGGSGLIGTPLRAALQDRGHQVRVLVRRPATGSDEITWDPSAGSLDPAALADADAVICLSGAGVGDHRWTDSYKRTLLTSRLDSVATISRALADRGAGGVLISASAVGYYGDTGDREVDESAGPGSDFLAQLCVQWEAEATPARDAGVRVSYLRTGLVLARSGGLLGRLHRVVQLGVAGKLGSGRQFTPWISLLDELRAIEFLLNHDVAGPINLTAPNPVRNAEFMTTLGRILHRPTVLPTPAFALKIVLGGLAGEVLAGQRAVPHRLSAAGFNFEHRDVDTALRWALNG